MSREEYRHASVQSTIVPMKYVHVVYEQYYNKGERERGTVLQGLLYIINNKTTQWENQKILFCGIFSPFIYTATNIGSEHSPVSRRTRVLRSRRGPLPQ